MDYYLELRRPLHLGVVPQKIHLPVEAKPIVIGRGSKAHVFLYAGEHPSFVSREHAKLEMDPVTDKWMLSDLDSVNGMFFNSVKLSRGQNVALNNGDRVYFGNPQHSFFVEYEFVEVPKRSPSPSGQISDRDSAVLDYGSDSSCSSSASRSLSPGPPRRLSSNTAGRPSSSSAAFSLASSFEEIPDDIWASRVFKYLDIRELHAAGWACRSWMRLANMCMDVAETIRWRHPWSVDSLVGVLQRRFERTNHPIRTIVTEGCYKVRDDHVERLAEICSEALMHVDFSGTPTLSPRGMRAIAEHCPNLKTLIVRGCKRVGGGTWEWMDDLTRNGQLEYCDLHCAGANDVAVTKVAVASPNLRRVDLGVMCTEGITDVGLLELTEHCPLLEHVDLRGCKRISNQGVALLVQRCGSTLKTLVLHSCGVGDEAARAIGQHCTVLEVLDLHRCTDITDEGMEALLLGQAQVCKTVKQLDLSNLNITDVGLGHLAKSKAQLSTLDLRSCKYITGAGLLNLIKVIGKTLLKLDLNGCTRLRPVDVLAIANACRGVLQELEIGAREEECDSWTRQEVALIRTMLGSGTRVHDAFDFPATIRRASGPYASSKS